MRSAMEQYPLHLNRILKTRGGVSGKERIKINFFVERMSACRDGFEFYAESAGEKNSSREL